MGDNPKCLFAYFDSGMVNSNDILSSNDSIHEAIQEDHFLDASGMFCPEPVMLLHGKIAQVCEGEILKVLATDPSTQRDIPKFCVFLGHELLLKSEADGVFHYYIRKGETSD